MNLEIKNRHGETLDYTFHEGDSKSKDLLVIGHGVTGNKDRPFIVTLSTALPAAGFNVLRFSFSGNGASGGRFADSTISKEVEDLGSLLDALAGWNITYAGHSMGGAVGVLRAAQDTRIHRLISLAGMVHTRDFSQREFGTVKPGLGFMWDDEACPLSQAYMDDLSRIGDVLASAPRIKAPWLLIHGTEDDVVPIKDSRDILTRANKATTQLVELPGSNHIFTGEPTIEIVKVVADWLLRH
ncbi:MAG: alpha/beta fold hydrolase [Pedosphaera sp.]|nr:alpha/beta fold hydrolase [Pedosphaera sp.]